MTQDVRDDLADPAFHDDPHPFYAQWRQTGPVREVRLPGGVDAWLVTRYEDARQALTDPRLSKSAPAQLRDGPLPPEIGAAIGHHMLNADPPRPHPADRAAVGQPRRGPVRRARTSCDRWPAIPACG
jgi:cytochrome P450